MLPHLGLPNRQNFPNESVFAPAKLRAAWRLRRENHSIPASPLQTAFPIVSARIGKDVRLEKVGPTGFPAAVAAKRIKNQGGVAAEAEDLVGIHIVVAIGKARTGGRDALAFPSFLFS